jgi:hypothetical protein
MRNFIAVFFVSLCLIIFGWWGLLSILIALPFVGWKDRHKGPFFTPKNGVSDFDGGTAFHLKYPISSRSLQDLLVDLSKGTMTEERLLIVLGALLDRLKQEGYGDTNDSDQDLLMGFLNQFSSFFPNWKAEYTFIAKSIRSKTH